MVIGTSGQHHWEHPGIDKYYYGSGKLLMRAIKKYGKENFSVHVLQWCNTKWDLNARERAWILMYDAVHSPEFYNITPGGDGTGAGEDHPMYGVQHTEETRQKMRKAHLGKHLSEETRKKMSENHADQSGKNNHRYGYHYTEEEKRKLSRANSKLTENQILEIVELRKQGFSQTEIAQKFGVVQQTISKICRGERFSFITGINVENKDRSKRIPLVIGVR